jgi:tight adherence protein B
MAGPKATARVLALLPAVGLLLGSGLGGSPVAWLLGTPLGWLMLALGLGLEAVGLWWVRRLVRGVEKHL